MSQDLITNLYNSFEPFQPLPAGDAAYVDLRSVRGDANILRDLGNKIIRSPGRNTCQLYAGHRGAGKSTELLRLQADLNQKGCFVVYFAADRDDLDPEDTEYTDILIACTRRLLEQLKNANPQPLLAWLNERQQDLKELAFTEIRFDDLKLETAIRLFGKLSSNIRAIPNERAKIRAKLDPHTVTLLSALNDFIQDGKRHLPSDQSQLVVIVDNLDRIVPINREEKRTNHEEIFIDRANQLKGLDCHLIYTIPISMVYSSRVSDLRDIYDNDPLVLPMIMVEMPDNQTVCKEGMDQLKELIARRVRKYAPTRPLETTIFESREVLEKLCLMSGGHIRNVMLLIRSAFDHIESLPITKQAVQRSITQAREIYHRTVEENQWSLLVEVYKSKAIKNDDEYRKLLFNRCILQYAFFDDEGEMQVWYDVHPLIRAIPEFKGGLS
ncbi:MAG: ATP-binding protein [Microcystaceae cyanobacterium]